ncbi:MAG: DUF5312 domain-containing protein [Spirochaetaceae bacterium]|nr:DUF5312 domain-containing protein [Spirochaetaceae bacterium]
MKRSVFEEMAVSISEKERRDLIKKINRNMNLGNTRIEESMYHVNISKEEKDKYIREEIMKLGFFERLILKIKKFFSGKTEEATYIDTKFEKLKRTILRKSPGIGNFTTRTISRSFPESLYNLFVKTSFLADILEEFWKKEDTFQQILTQLVESRFPGIVKKIDDLLSDEDAEKILFEKETKTAIKEEVLRRFNNYAKKVSDSIFVDIEEEVLPLYYFRPIIVFPYYELFKIFGFDPYSENNLFAFKNAPVFSCIDYIEKLYYAIYMVLKITRPIKTNPFLGKYFYRDGEEEKTVKEIEKEGADSQDEQEQEENFIYENSSNSSNRYEDEEIDRNKLKWFYKKLEDIYEESRKINKKIPLVEIIKYYRNDYYYKLAFYIPKLKFKELYFANLKIQILEQVNDKYIRARNFMIEKNIDKFFRGKTIMEFAYFKNTGFDHEKAGVNNFKNIKSMELLFNYLVHYYNERVRNIIDLSTKTILTQDKITATSLMLQISAIDDAYVKIQDFDKSLSPDMEDGKRFFRLRYGLTNDTAYLKMYKSFIAQKNKAAKDIIHRAIEAFDNIIKTYSELLNSSQLEIKNNLATQYNVDGKTKSFRDFLIESVENIRYFKNLLSQVMKSESGVA